MNTTGVAVDQQMMTAVAVALATKAADSLAEGAKAAFDALARLVRRAFGGHPSAQAALTDAEADPADETRIVALRQALAQAVADDPGFEAELRGLWQRLAPHLAASDGSVANSVSGTVEGNVVQARDVHGSITFGSPDRSKP